jgi:hypothetical protein
MKQLKITIWVAAFVFAATACNKDETERILGDDKVKQEVVAENLMSEVDIITEEVIDSQLGNEKSATIGSGSVIGDYPTVTFDKNSVPQKITIDFGSGCTGLDGVLRSGKIIITSSLFENKTVERTFSFDHFTSDEYGIDGEVSKTVTLDVEDHSRTAEITEDIEITFEDNTQLERKANLIREHLFGSALAADDVTNTWGEVISTFPDDITITKTIAEATPLQFKWLCLQLVSGVATFDNGSRTWVIDYGDGECDNEATVTVNGVSQTVKLRNY